jgi:UDP-glucose 4-epimerase
VYGAPLVGVLTERSPTRPVHPYAITHRAAEDFVFGEASRGGLEPLVIRLSNAVGAPASATVERWTLLVNDLSRQIVVDGRMTLRSAGLQQRDFIPMTDVCRAIAHLLEQPAERLQDGLFNLGGGRSLRVIDVAQRLAARAEALLGFLPEIARPAPRDGESAPTLDYRIDKLLGSGFSLEGDLDRELEDTLRFCQAVFGAGRAGGERMAPPSASAHG